MNCHVLRCGESGVEVWNVGAAETGRIEVLLCANHLGAFNRGDRWLWQPDESGLGSVLMGRDLPPELESAGASGGLLSNEGRVKTIRLQLRQPDGSERDSEFVMTGMTAKMLRRLAERF